MNWPLCGLLSSVNHIGLCDVVGNYLVNWPLCGLLEGPVESLWRGSCAVSHMSDCMMSFAYFPLPILLDVGR